MTAMVNVLMTGIVIAGGAFAIVYALRFFPIAKPASDQLEMDLDIAPDYIKRSRVMAHDARREADILQAETSRIKAKPRLKRH
jgi:hypothetical protein